MTEHDWQPIAEDEPSIMCTVCFECKCCSDWTDECPGEWVPEDDDFMKEPSEKSRELVRKWRQLKTRVQYADPEEVRKAAEKIVSKNQELLDRLADM